MIKKDQLDKGRLMAINIEKYHKANFTFGKLQDHICHLQCFLPSAGSLLKEPAWTVHAQER